MMAFVTWGWAGRSSACIGGGHAGRYGCSVAPYGGDAAADVYRPPFGTGAAAVQGICTLSGVLHPAVRHKLARSRTEGA